MMLNDNQMALPYHTSETYNITKTYKSNLFNNRAYIYLRIQVLLTT